MTKWVVVSDDGSESEPLDSRSEAEDRLDDLNGIVDAELKQKETDGGKVEVDSAEVVEMSGGDGGNENGQDDDKGDDIEAKAQEPDTKQALEKLGDSIEEDPLSVLPSYMITTVDNKPSLNKRGVSVLAYHYDIDVIEREVVAYPHDHDYETAVVEIMVEGGDGRTFSGIGEAHADETPKHQLLRMAETRAYKRAASRATGVGMLAVEELQAATVGGDSA